MRSLQSLFPWTRSETHTYKYNHPFPLPIYQSLTPTHTYTHTSCLQTSNLVRFTFAGLGGWCQGVMSAECDLPCREHYYPREEFNTGGSQVPSSAAPSDMRRGWSCSFKEKDGLHKNTQCAIQRWLLEHQSAVNMLPH